MKFSQMEIQNRQSADLKKLLLGIADGEKLSVATYHHLAFCEKCKTTGCQFYAQVGKFKPIVAPKNCSKDSEPYAEYMRWIKKAEFLLAWKIDHSVPLQDMISLCDFFSEIATP